MDPPCMAHRVPPDLIATIERPHHYQNTDMTFTDFPDERHESRPDLIHFQVPQTFHFTQNVTPDVSLPLLYIVTPGERA